MHELAVALSFDVDNDFCQNPKESGELAWRGLDIGAGLALQALTRISQELSLELVSTWFIRMDEQVRALCGSTTWAAERFSDAYGPLFAEQGVELQWHAHLYRRGAEGWHNELDGQAQAQQLHRSHADMRAAGFDCRLSRIGESLFSNWIGATLVELGMLADSTAMPGRYREDCFDWRGTPEQAYFQDKSDYRIAAKRGLLQLPFSMLKVKADYDPQPFSRYLNLGFLHRVMDAPMRELVASAPYLICVAHPFELLPEAKHPLWGGTVDNFVANLVALIEACRAIGRPLRFVKMSELVGVCWK